LQFLLPLWKRFLWSHEASFPNGDRRFAFNERPVELPRLVVLALSR
jgi:hypothetical protein